MPTAFSKKEFFGLGRVPIGIGAVLKGWDFSEEEFRDPKALPIVDFRAMTGACLHDCFHCFTDKESKTLSLEQIKSVIDQLAEMKTHAIDFLGEGEPTLDPDFFEIIEYTASKGIQPVIFSDAATNLRDPVFAKRLYLSGASVLPKCDSLWNPDYQNWVVGDQTGKFFGERNEALKLLMETGFNKKQPDGTTRLGFDMVISKKNVHEVEKTLRFCRENNLWVIFCTFLPSGRSGSVSFDKSFCISEEEKKEMEETVKRVDKEFGFDHAVWNNFATLPCMESLCICGDGRVYPCVGNETVVGNVQTDSIRELSQRILKKFPKHNRATFDGNCLYRPLL